jgi:hypothetical protein
MNKTKINFIIDALMMMLMASIIGLGLLIKYVLLPGKEAWNIYGRKVDLLFLGLSRHEWGSIHFIIGIILVVLLVLHVILHWQMILNVYRKLLVNKHIRYCVTSMFVLLCVSLVICPIFINPEIKYFQSKNGFQIGHNKSSNDLLLPTPAREDNILKQKVVNDDFHNSKKVHRRGRKNRLNRNKW